jgi:Ca-activated chloride channel family protein
MRTKPLVQAVAVALLVAAAGCMTRQSAEPVTDTEARERDADGRTAVRLSAERKEVAAVDGQPAGRGAEEPPREAGEPESISVAGSRIKRTDATTAQPVFAVAAAPSVVPMAPSAGALGDTYWQPSNTENYADHADNPVVVTAENPVSTFSIDVDTGSYSNVRRMIQAGALPPADAVRAEEFINYFDYAYTPPATLDQPFSVTTELAPAPWNAQRQLLLVGIKGYEAPASALPPSNLVFLVDTSGSMQSPNKLPLVKEALRQLVPQLRREDRISLVVYAGSAGLVLPPTPGDQPQRIFDALDALGAGGSTNGGEGIALAYAMAQQAFIQGGVNRVILATDGDFNVGTVDTEALKTMVADKRKGGVALTTLGFGQGNYNDELAEQLADIGDGNHAYIDTAAEARKVLVDEVGATLLTIAKDVKIQIEFNPTVVAEYRLIGYENRMLRREDFNNDKVDAGEIGAGHDVTALYELTLVGSSATQVDPLRYGDAIRAPSSGSELAFLKLRYKRPGEGTSRLIERPVQRSELTAAPSGRLALAAAVAGFADALRGGARIGEWTLADVAALASSARVADTGGYRAELVTLIEKAATLQTTAASGSTVAIGH